MRNYLFCIARNKLQSSLLIYMCLVAAGFSLRLFKKTQAKACSYQSYKQKVILKYLSQSGFGEQLL